MFPRLLRRFVADRRASVLPLFAAAIIPVVALVGVAVDYSLASTTRTRMQGALDATALMLSKQSANLSDTELSTKATEYFNALFNSSEANVQIAATRTESGGSTLTVTGTGSLKTNFTNVLGISNTDLASSSTVKWGSTKLRVALALDVTGSMNENGKLSSLKTATHQLLTLLQNASATTGDVQVAIIPFAKDVNVGASNYNANWIDWTAWDAANGSHGGGSGFCFFGWCWNGSGWVQAAWVPKNHNTWNGCVTDRTQDYDVTNASPNPGTTATLFPAEQYNACPVALMPLTYNWTALHGLVDQLQANGATNQPIGLVWAWHALTSAAPLNAPPLPADTQQVIILLSDGLNTQDRWYGNGSDHSTQVDARMTLVCQNAKNAQIQIYTVLVMAGNSSVLQNCATKPEMYFALTTAGQMVSTFNQIGTQIAKLRVAK